jgi:hypothetical protein
MSGFAPSVTQSFILFMLMLSGFTAGKVGVLKGETIRGLSRFLLDFTLPALIIHSMQRPFSADLRDQAFRILGLSALIYASAFPLAYVVTAFFGKSRPAETGVHRFAMCFSNVGFMGFPVAEAILGRESLFMVSIYNIPFQLLAFSVGTTLIAAQAKVPGSKPGQVILSAARSFINVPALAALVGFGFFMLAVRIPEPLFSTIGILGNTTTPLSMVLIGAVLAGTKLGNILGNPRVWVTTGYRLIVHPLVVFLLLRLLGLSGLERSVPVLIAAMPVAANTTILAGVYGGDDVTASGLVFISTLLSLATIPLIAAFMV